MTCTYSTTTTTLAALHIMHPRQALLLAWFSCRAMKLVLRTLLEAMAAQKGANFAVGGVLGVYFFIICLWFINNTSLIRLKKGFRGGPHTFC
jgi:hypothetical protein